MTPLIFISYSHKDRKWLDFVQSHLQVAVTTNHFQTWDDRKTKGGEDWLRELDEALRLCSVFVLLISRDSLTSNFILKREVQRAVRAHWGKGKKIYPIVVRSCDLKAVPWLTKMNLRPLDGRALATYRAPEREKIMADLVAELRGILDHTSKKTVSRQTSRKRAHNQALGLPRKRNTPEKAGRAHFQVSEATANHNLTPFNDVFAERIQALQVSHSIKESVRSVVAHSEYPVWMSIAGRLVRNPIWDEVPKSKIYEMANTYSPAGANPPQLMHLDILLVKRSDEQGHGLLYTYYSRDWGTHLLTFRPRLPQDKGKQRSQLNAAKLARHWKVDPEAVEVHPLRGKFAISLKPHARYRDLTLYVFELCTVKIDAVPGTYLKPLRAWLDLKTLRSDPTSWSMNGDVIRAIHELFTYDLGPLPVSLR